MLVAEKWGIGARGTGTERFFRGLIDEVRIYNRALSATEVQLLSDIAKAFADSLNLEETLAVQIDGDDGAVDLNPLAPRGDDTGSWDADTVASGPDDDGAGKELIRTG